jgi:hypothetical protein
VLLLKIAVEDSEHESGYLEKRRYHPKAPLALPVA